LKIKIPLKAKIFLCFFITGVTLTKDNDTKKYMLAKWHIICGPKGQGGFGGFGLRNPKQMFTQYMVIQTNK
jgi:hypothetical protein